MLYHSSATSIEIPSIVFLKAKQNLEIVSRIGKCMSLFRNRTKHERIYYCEMTNSLVLILLNHATTWSHVVSEKKNFVMT